MDLVIHFHFTTQAEREQRIGQLKEAENELTELKAEKRQVSTQRDFGIENQKREMNEMGYQFRDMVMMTLRDFHEMWERRGTEGVFRNSAAKQIH
jgi:hypothetical protein